jgi:hypothetical protein
MTAIVVVLNAKKMGISAKTMLTRLQSLSQPKLETMVNEEIVKEETALKTLKEQDFLEGDIYGNGTLVSYRSKNYEIFKFSKNPLAGGAVDLINTGAFVDAMKLNKPKGNKYLFGNTDRKRKLLVDKYGIDIMGLNQTVFDKFQIEIIKPRFVRKLKDILNA